MENYKSDATYSAASYRLTLSLQPYAIRTTATLSVITLTAIDTIRVALTISRVVCAIAASSLRIVFHDNEALVLFDAVCVVCFIY